MSKQSSAITAWTQVSLQPPKATHIYVGDEEGRK